MPSRTLRLRGVSITKYNLHAAVTAGVLGILFFILIVHQRTLRFEKYQLTEDTRAVFLISKEVSTNIRDAVYSAAALPYPPCSERDLDALRDTLWQYKYLKDIGRVSDNKLICTAGRGRLSKPRPLPPSAHEASGAKHWQQANDILKKGVSSDMALHKNTLSFTNPFVLTQRVTELTNAGIFVLPPNRAFIYRRFGDLPDTVLKDNPLTSWSWVPGFHDWLRVEFCADNGVVCTVGIKKNVGFIYLHWFYQALTVFIGLNIGIYTYLLFYAFSSRKRSLNARLKNAISHQRMYLEYQPKYQLATGKIVGAEALVRWHDGYLGQVSPDLFIAAAEELGIIERLTDWVIDTAIGEMATILRTHRDFHLSINLSMQDLTRPQVLDQICKRCNALHVTPAQMVFELTERSISGHESMAESANEFRRRGYQISLDDFGTGYSNLSWLTQLDADEIKVDCSFTQAIGTSSINQSMLDAIFMLIEKLNVRVVFEGIEKPEEVDYILSHAPQAIGQGWLMSKSISASALRMLIQANDSAHNASPSHDDESVT